MYRNRYDTTPPTPLISREPTGLVVLFPFYRGLVRVAKPAAFLVDLHPIL